MRIGLCGLSKVGKTCVFEAVSGQCVQAHPHAPNLAAVAVPDERLDRLFNESQRPKKVQVKIEYLDPYAPETGAEDALTPYLNAVKGAPVLALVVRGFENPNVPHVHGCIDMQRDINDFVAKTLERDIATCERRIERIDVMYRKAKSQELERERDVIVKCLSHLRCSEPLQRLALRPEEQEAIKSIEFFTAKPLLIVLNVDEKDAATARLDTITAEFRRTAPGYATVTALCARLERELLELCDDDRLMFMGEMCLSCLAQERIIKASFEATETICFYTIGDDEVRAWPLKTGASAVEAAGAVHTDMARGFIRAEVLAFNDYLKAGSMREAKAQKLVRLEGKEYLVADGDIIQLRFHV
ncbi:MAG: redox-regulated ATPase YchF [Candidatus Coatesbacteria bacterium]|nr:redox-regulated ATPase YchF [Candidatus Coatesbacteria bacterium]